MNPSSPLRPLVAAASCAMAALCAEGQGTFQNLDFEAASVPSVPPDQPITVDPAAALPGWTGYVGTSQVNQVWYNGVSVGGALISLIDRHTGGAFALSNYVIAGNFTATLDAGLYFPGGGQDPLDVPAAIAQVGRILSSWHSVTFSASGSVADLLLTFNGQPIPFVPLGAGPNFVTYGGDISAFRNRTGELRFTEQPITSPFSTVFLDAIQFSDLPIPEPGSWALLLCGAGVLGLSRWRCAK